MAATDPRHARWRYWVIVHNVERARDWQDVYGTRQVPVREPVIEYAYLPGFADTQPVYMLAMDWLDHDQRERLIAHCALRFQLPEGLVRRDLDRVGIPLLATDCVLLVDGREAQPGLRRREGFNLRMLVP